MHTTVDWSLHVHVAVEHYTLNVRSWGKQLVLFSLESRCFLRQSLREHQDSRENKTNWFPCEWKFRNVTINNDNDDDEEDEVKVKEEEAGI